MSVFILGAHAVLSLTCACMWRLLGAVEGRLILGKIVFAFYALASMLVYLELGAGVVFPRPRPRVTPYVSAPVVGWRMRPDFSGTYLGTTLQTNTDGFRSPVLPLRKGEGTVRVICLGDSVTFGHGLKASEAYPQRLQAFLNHRMPVRQWDVIDAGVEGYCTFQETEALRWCIKYDPDLVVLLFCLNDVTEKYLALRRFGGTGLEYHGVADGTASRIFQTLVAMRRYSSLATALTPTRAEAERREVYSVQMLWEQPSAKHVREAWEQVERELDELRMICETHRLGLLIAAAPYREQFVDRPEVNAPQRRLEHYAQTYGIAFVCLKSQLMDGAREAGLSPASFYVDSSHLTVAGNGVIAGAIANEFRVPRPSDGRAAVSSWERVLRELLGQEGASGS